MKNILYFISTLIFAGGVISERAKGQSTLHSQPYGFVTVTVSAGAGLAKRISLISIPLLGEAHITGRSVGIITEVGEVTITSNNANWLPGELSSEGSPFLLEVTSGRSQGRMLLLSTSVGNTSDTVTLDAGEAVRTGDLTALELEGSGFVIRPVDTLSSFFGTPESTLVKGGGSPSEADTLTIVTNGSAQTYFYNTAAMPPRWSRVALGFPDASNTPLLPSAGIQYARLPSTPLQFVSTGVVPSPRRQVRVKNSGLTLLSSFWPHSQTLSTLNLEATDYWTAGSTAVDADKIIISIDGSSSSFFYSGSNWRRVSLGSPIADGTQINLGSGMIIQKKGEVGGYSTYSDYAPYTLK